MNRRQLLLLVSFIVVILLIVGGVLISNYLAEEENISVEDVSATDKVEPIDIKFDDNLTVFYDPFIWKLEAGPERSYIKFSGKGENSSLTLMAKEIDFESKLSDLSLEEANNLEKISRNFELYQLNQEMVGVNNFARVEYSIQLFSKDNLKRSNRYLIINEGILYKFIYIGDQIQGLENAKEILANVRFE